MIKIKILKEKEKLVGGAGDNVPDSDFDPKQLATGIKDETGEHTPDPTIGKEIAKDHLSNDPDYYKKLKAAGIDEKKNNKLSSYWKKRAKRRAIKAKRTWPNSKDRKWALEEQEKSSKINNDIYNLFEKELDINEEFTSTIEEFLKKVKEARQAALFKPDAKTMKNRPKPSKKAKQIKGEKNPITGKIRRTPNSVAVGAGFGGPAE